MVNRIRSAAPRTPRRAAKATPAPNPAPADEPVTQEAAPPARPSGFDGYIVAIGASAGGLEALERFFGHCPADSGAAFVVIQHLSPDHKSMMHDLLARYTRMAVQVVADGMAIEANHVYLIPPGTVMRIAGGRFSLTPKNPHLLTLPIDIFFQSLAEEQGARAIGVVLSGTGSDGTRGAAAINAAGGFLLAQDPQDARFDGMPSSVIATGLVDVVLSADALAPRVVAHIRNLPVAPEEEAADLVTRVPLAPDEALEGILQLLLQSGGIDFHDYKPATLLRRIERRMQLHRLRSLDAYLDLLEQDRGELTLLRRELLIPVTSFFRDPEAFETLRTDVIEPLVEQGGDTLRVWVAGCSTGEEAYSIAMLFLEAFDAHKRWPGLKIFATDVSQQNVDFAAAGQYPESAAAELTPERLERFFLRSGGRFSVKPELRQTIVFARHNLLVDPPFTRMALVSCRNTLIYFTADAQRRALGRLQYAIRPGGYLFLGSSESLTGSANGFATVHAKHKIFKRVGDVAFPSTFSAEEALRSGYAPSARGRRGPVVRQPLPDGGYVDDAIAALLDDFVPPSMLVNERHEVLHMFGDVAPFFRARAGTASLEIGRILPEHVVPVASALLFKAGKEGQRMVSDLLRMPSDDNGPLALRLIARPLPPRGEERLLLLSFQVQRATDAGTTPAETVNVNAETAARVEILERELQATRESLQATIEELETSNEELQATNEELMASNEELQSSNEELQSVNEELNTVNAEFQEKMAILNRVNADLDHMLKAVGVATVFVDADIRLTRFSPDAATIFKLRDSDIGRPLDEIAHVLKYPNLIEDMRLTFATGRMLEREARGPDGRTYLIRILPYAIASSAAKGVVATFVDISAFHDRQRLQNILDALPEHVAVLEPDGTIAMVNRAWVRFAKANGDPELRHSGVGVNYLNACQSGGSGLEDAQARRARQGIKRVLEGTASTFSMTYPCHSPTERRWFVMNVAPIPGQQYGAVVSHFNITSWYTDPNSPGHPPVDETPAHGHD